MKKCYLYILFGIICFFGFSMGVSADYNSVCTYTKVVKRDSHEYSHVVEVLYDKQKNKFKIIYQPLTNFVDDGQHFLEFDDNDTSIMPKEAFTNIKNNKCPVNELKINDGSKNDEKRICFYENCDNKWLIGKYEEGATGQRYIGSPVLKTKKNLGLFEGKYTSSVTGKAYVNEGNNNKYNIKDNGECGFHVFLDGIKCKDNKTCKPQLNVLFTYNSSNGGLDISYKTNSKDNYTTISSSSPSIGFNYDSTFFQVFFTTNTYFEDVPDEFKVKTRDEFKEKFLKKWSESGSCPGGSMEVVRLNSQDLNNFLLGFEGIKQYFKETGNTTVNTDAKNSLVDLKKWEIEWPDWQDNDENVNDCKGLLGSDIIDLINEILLYVRILVPILLIGLGISDFIKAMVSSDEQAMSKAKNKFLKRLIVAAVIFLIPSLVNLIFNAINGIWAHINNNACNIWNY